jgi:hypothetical protein
VTVATSAVGIGRNLQGMARELLQLAPRREIRLLEIVGGERVMVEQPGLHRAQ